MSSMTAFLILLAVHWFADFCIQTHWQAQNKSKRNDALMSHVLTYSACLTVAAGLLFPSPQWLGFVWLNALLHFATDYCTSRASSRLYAQERRHDFFVVIGFDQLIHQATLAATMKVFFGWT